MGDGRWAMGDARWAMCDARVSPNGAEAQSPGLPAWRATLGRRGKRSTTPTGLRHRGRETPQPRWGCLRSARVPRVGPRNGPTLGFEPQPRWGCLGFGPQPRWGWSDSFTD